jgi:acyl-CoA dehydrogenase
MNSNTNINMGEAEQQETLAALTDTLTRFSKREIEPHIHAWDEAGEFPRSLYLRAAELGLLGMGYPEHLGGSPATWRMRNTLSQQLSRMGGSGGLLASLFSHNIGLPPVLRYGSEALQQRVIPPVLRGEKIAALAITEPSGGSDVAALRCTATRDGSDYIINGEKVFITSGMRADYITVAVRTGEAGNDVPPRFAAPQGGVDALGRPSVVKGSGGISMILVDANTAGISRTKLEKMGWWCSDTAHIRFDNVRVPAVNLLGEEGAGFKIIMTNFNGERLAMSAMALGFAQACFDEALDWARQRKTFGNTLMEHQVIRHKLVDMQMRMSSTQAWLDAVTARADAGDTGADWVAQVCMLKNHATQTMQFCADQAVQILGAMGFMRGTKSERIYREVKVMMIGGGAEEIMKELAARQLGL